MKLVGANALLRSGHQIHRLTPDAQWYMAPLEDGADLDGEWLAALVAFVGADPGALAPHLTNTVNAATVRAHRTFRPNPRLHERAGSFLVVKVRCGNCRHGSRSLLQAFYPVAAGYVRYNNAEANR